MNIRYRMQQKDWLKRRNRSGRLHRSRRRLQEPLPGLQAREVIDDNCGETAQRRSV